MKCSCSRLDRFHSDPSLTQSMHVLWIMCFFCFSCAKDLKAVFLCLSIFPICLLLSIDTILDFSLLCNRHSSRVCIHPVVFFFLKAVVLSCYHGSRLLVDSVSFYFFGGCLGGCPIYIWLTKPKLLYEWTLSAHLHLLSKVVRKRVACRHVVR